MSLKFNGIKSKNIQTFNKKYKTNTEEATNYRDEGNEAERYFYNAKTKEIIKANVKNNFNNVKNIIKNWGVNKLNNKNLIVGDEHTYKKILTLYKDMDDIYAGNKQIKLNINISYAIQVSDYAVMRKQNKIFNEGLNFINPIQTERELMFNGRINNFYNFVLNQIIIYVGGFGYNRESVIRDLIYDNVENWISSEDYQFYKLAKRENGNYYTPIIAEVKITDLNDLSTFYLDPVNKRLREPKFYDIKNLYNEVIEIKPTNENCVKQFLKLNYKKISENTIDKLGNNEGITPAEIIEFSKKYNIKSILYDIDGQIIADNIPEKTAKNKSYKNLVGICYNNHFYGIKNKYLNKKQDIKKTEIKTDEEIQTIFNKNLENYIIPSNIKIKFIKDELKINSFILDGIAYLENPEYKKCLDILNKLGLKDKMTPSTNFLNISSIIEKLYIKNSCCSFFPVNVIKPAYNYYNNNLNHVQEIEKYITIDHSKFYSNILKNLSYLIKLDYRQSKINKYTKETQPKEIYNNHLYIVDPELSTLLLPNVDFYTGEHLIYCIKEGLKFVILEEIEAEKVENYYKSMVEDMYKKLDHKHAKEIINIMIGKMKQDEQIKENIKIVKVANKDERATDKSTNYLKYNEYTFFKYEITQNIKNIYNKKPINIQIKDNASIILYEKIKSLKLKENELVSIETDSITFINTGQYEKLKNTLSDTDWTKWKRIYKNLDYFIKHLDYDNITFKNECSFYDTITKQNKNILFDCYAGAGKSHRIKNEIIPMIKDDYIILTPKHTVNKAYLKNNLNSKVVQTYIFNKQVPTEKYIIIDEIGLFNREAHDLLYKCFLMDKIIYSLGDHKQLLPIFENTHFNTPQYIKLLYNKVYNINTNYRNNFKKDYYDELINNKIDLVEEIKKHRTKNYKDAEIIICITNNEINEYNNKMLNHLNINFGDVGCKIISITNDLRDKEIYNNFDYEILEILEDENEEIIYKIDDDIYINEKELNNNFKPNYAITLFKAQGEEYKSFFVPDSSLKYIDGRQAYTIISRLKQDLTEETKKTNKEIEKNIIISY